VFDIGAGEMIGLVILGLLLFGPERLPGFAADIARTIRKVRAFATSATSELKENLGPELSGIADLNPRAITREMGRSLLEDDQPRSTPEPRIDPDAT
jgi:sec-independent protein translocase protein TatB